MKSDNGEFLFTAPVMIPGRPDCDYERGETPFTADEIRFFKESFDDYQIIDKEHQVFNDIGSAKSVGIPTDSFILNKDTTYELVDGSYETYPIGTWMLTANVTDPHTQQEIQDGKLTGWSPSVNTSEVASLIKEYMSTKSSAGQLIHDIEDPATVTVSIVGKPCQSGSKQCKLKNGSDNMSEDAKTLSKIREILGGKPESATKSDFDALAKELKESQEIAMKSMGEHFGVVIDEAIKEALSDLGALKEDKKEDEEETPSESEETEETQDTEESETEETMETEEEDEEDEEEKEGATKSNSKTPPIHDGGVIKSDENLDTYSFLGRNSDGTRKRI